MNFEEIQTRKYIVILLIKEHFYIGLKYVIIAANMVDGEHTGINREQHTKEAIAFEEEYASLFFFARFSGRDTINVIPSFGINRIIRTTSEIGRASCRERV